MDPCESRQSEPKMKRIAFGTLGAILALALVGCGKGEQQNVPSGSVSGDQEKAAAATSISSRPVVLDAGALASAKPTGEPCSLDSIDGNYAKQVIVAANKPHTFRGWLLNALRQPAGQFSLVLEGKRDFAIAAVTGVSRPDVGAYLKDSALGAAGFVFSSVVGSVPLGDYKLTLLVDRGGVVYSCDVEKTLVVN